jgi:hypothetical protein
MSGERRHRNDAVRSLFARAEAACGWPVRITLSIAASRAMRSAQPRATVSAMAIGARLNGIADTFLDGYRAALEEVTNERLAARLETVALTDRGFAYEGASMALAVLDGVIPWRARRFQSFVRELADAHVYMAHVGAGWAAARLGRPADGARRGLDPLLGWLAVDGYGFHQGYFHSDVYVTGRVVPHATCGYAARAFDQGLGRSLWFVDGADVDRIARTVATFPPSRRSDLWSGVALAATYAGGVSVDRLRALKRHAAGYERDLAQAAAFAAEARIRAANPAPHTDMACNVLGGIAARDAALIARRLAAEARDQADVPSYEDWRQRVGAAVIAKAATVGDRRQLQEEQEERVAR